MTIQEQVEQFNRKWYLNDYHKTGLGYVEMKKDTSALLRAFLEECCAAECQWCKEGLPVSKRRGRWMHDPGEPAFYRNCDADNIRLALAWLEEK